MKTLLIGASIIVLGAGSALANGPTPSPAAAQPGIVDRTPEVGTSPQVTPAPQPTPPPATAQTQPARPAAEPAATDRFVQTAGFGIGGLYGFRLDGSDHLAGLNLTYDHGINPGIGLELEQAVFWGFGDGVGGRSAAGVNFNLGAGEGVIPYVGGNFGAFYGNGISNSLFAGPEIGLRLFGLDTKVAYDMPFNKSMTQGNIIATVGVGIRF
jgi:hypothetical protein